MRVAVLTSHPIQYQAPWFRSLAKEVDLEVFFAHRQTPTGQAAAGFGIEFEWDVDLLDGYSYTFLENISKKPSVNHFWGCNTPEIAMRIASGKFDAVIIFGWNLYSYLQALCACRRQNLPLFVRSDSQLVTSRSLAKRVLKVPLYRWLMKQFYGFFYVGQRSKEYYRYYGAPESRLFFSPHCIDNSLFRNNLNKCNDTLDQTDKGGTVLLFVGKFIPKKRPQDVILAVSLLKKRGINASGVFVGSGPMESKLRELATELGIAHDIYFEGFKNQKEIVAYYCEADILVLPSDGGETWGLVVNEAMACGLPAIVSNEVGCAPDLIEVGKTGEVYEMGNIQELVAAIERFIPICRSKEVKKAVAEKSASYSVDRSTDGVLEAFVALGK